MLCTEARSVGFDGAEDQWDEVHVRCRSDGRKNQDNNSTAPGAPTRYNRCSAPSSCCNYVNSPRSMQNDLHLELIPTCSKPTQSNPKTNVNQDHATAAEQQQQQ